MRFADDVVLGFQYKTAAERYFEALKERLSSYGLTLHSRKTRLIEFGRYAAARRKKRGEGKPEGFDFLGFTHLCSKTRKGDYFLKRKTKSKGLRQTFQAIKASLRKQMHAPLHQTGTWLRRVVQGHGNLFWCATGQQFIPEKLQGSGCKSVVPEPEASESERSNHDVETVQTNRRCLYPPPPDMPRIPGCTIRHHSRQEPYAVIPHVRICTGGIG